MPLVSVVIPARNVERTIGATLESLLSQNCRDYEIIVVDDHSTDATKEVCKKYGVKVIDSVGSGANAARNTGVREASGEIVALIDGDAIAPENWLFKLVEKLTSSGVDLVFGRVEALNSDKLVSRYVKSSMLRLMPNFRKEELISNKQVSTVVAGCNMGFWRKVWEAVGFFDEDYVLYYDEVDFEAKALSKGFKVLLDPNLVVYHKNVEKPGDLLKRAWRQAGALKVFRRKNPNHPVISLVKKLCLLVSLCFTVIAISIAYYLSYAVKTPLTGSVIALISLYVALVLYYLTGKCSPKDSLIFPFLDLIVGLTMYFRILMDYAG